MFEGLSWPYGDVLAEMAQFDLLTSQTKYKDVVNKFFLPSLQGLRGDPQ